MSALTTLTLAATLASASVLPGSAPPLSHSDEIKLFASTAAVAWTASKVCSDMMINQAMIVDFRDRLHLTAVDLPATDDEIRFAISVLKMAISASASVQQWCDETYEMYGPKGTMIPELVKR